MAEKVIRTIGVLTSGGDAPGMNAAIRAVVRTALGKGLKVRGIRRGYSGLLNEEIIDLSARDVSDTIQRGGTILLTARCEEMRTPEGQQKAAAICKKYGIDGLVVIGGDGSFKGAQKLSDFGVNTIGLPGTIDLDIACTEYTIGFDTAVNTAMEAIDKVRGVLLPGASALSLRPVTVGSGRVGQNTTGCNYSYIICSFIHYLLSQASGLSLAVSLRSWNWRMFSEPTLPKA